jgi:hypothetical protein
MDRSLEPSLDVDLESRWHTLVNVRFPLLSDCCSVAPQSLSGFADYR